ncbi:acyl-CoA thioesterase [Ruminococcaceae bacterium OttesenSCG-928-I18]|nr:acyl-CoA thioesterase [Ruminococcaceae bacterium OttesenSCG-928-I18]
MEITPFIRKANYYETDQMGIIHHSNYIRWFEEARIDYMEKMGYGYEKANEAGIDFALLGLCCEYKSMVRFGDTVRIIARVIHFTPSRMTVGYRVLDEKTGELRTTGESRHCYFDNRKRRPVSLKKALPELYAKFDLLKITPEEFWNGEIG